MRAAIFPKGPVIIALTSMFLVACTHAQAGLITVVDSSSGMRTADFLSDPYLIDKLYPSMLGPMQTQSISLNTGRDELLWLLGYDVSVTNAEGTPLPDQRNLCHAQVTYGDRDMLQSNTEKYFNGKRAMPPKWFIAIPGQASLSFPPGFGIPIHSTEPLSAMTMVLNRDAGAPVKTVRMRTRLLYVPESERKTPIRPLGRFAVAVTVPMEEHHHAEGDMGCAIDTDDGFVTFAKTVSGSDLLQRKGDTMTTAHFLVPPGTHQYREQFHGAEQIPFNTTLHSISAHLHTYGTSAELWDVTTNTMLFKSVATDDPAKLYVTNMTSYSSADGIFVFTDHDYEIRATYENTTDSDIDAMAVMYFYFLDRGVL